MSSPFANLPGLDLQEAMDRVGVAPEIFLPIVKRFAQVNRDMASRLLVALEAGQLGKLRELTHSLKAASGGIGAHTLQGKSLDVEMAANQGADRAEIKSLVLILSEELDLVVDSIDSLG